MRISNVRDVKPGEIWAVGGADAAARTEWCRRAATDEELTVSAALLSFAQHAAEAQRTGWPQARYYEDEGKTVGDFLSYDAVYDINPFEIGARRPETRKAFKVRAERIKRLLDLRKLNDRLVIALSNGETRRVLFARALAKGPKVLVLDDPAAGLDVKQREKLKAILAALAARGLAIVMAYRHLDELPAGVTKWLTVDAKGVAREVKGFATGAGAGAPPPQTAALSLGAGAPPPPQPAKSAATPHGNAKPVVEIRDLELAYGARTLFSHFSWTVRAGERWVLRGENGSGKTTLFALITGDSPLAYAADIRVFGIPRETGAELARIRRRIGMVSPEMQAYLGKSPFDLLAAAFRGNPKLLLLDEPFMNMETHEARLAARKIAAFLRAHPTTAAILICHRSDEAPRCFTRELNLDV